MIQQYLNIYKWPITIGGAIVIFILIFFYGTKAWNGVDNILFRRKTNVMTEDTQKKLADAERQKAELEKTLLELDRARDDLAKAKRESDEMRAIFNDSNKSAKDKVKAFEDSLTDAPVHTDTTGITTDDLCQRARANGSSPGVIAALCAN